MKIFVCFRSAKFFAFLFFTIISVSACAGAGPWKGRVVDIDTKEPLEGAAVVAVWYRAYFTPFGRNHSFYEAMETQTDKTGAFEIEAYSPINLLPIISEMEGPKITIYKPGYMSITKPMDDFLLAGSTREPAEYNQFSLYTPTKKETKKYRLSHGLVELPKLTKEERLNNFGKGHLPGVPEYKIELLIELRDLEFEEIGLTKSEKREKKRRTK